MARKPRHSVAACGSSVGAKARTWRCSIAGQDGRAERLPGLVAELLQQRSDVIFVSGPHAIAAAKKATSTVPIVFVLLTDPVEMGFVRSLARPGGNMTGLSSQFEELITKQLQLLKEAVPNLSLLRHSESSPPMLKAAETAARSLGLTARTLTGGNRASSKVRARDQCQDRSFTGTRDSSIVVCTCRQVDIVNWSTTEQPRTSMAAALGAWVENRLYQANAIGQEWPFSCFSGRAIRE